MNIAYSDLQVAAKTAGCNNGASQKVIYQFLDDCHCLCLDKKEIFESEIRACETLLRYTQDLSEKVVLESEITELRTVLKLLRQEDPASAFSQDKAAKKAPMKKANFLICQDCYWCASCFKQNSLPECPACNGRNIDALPVFENEQYRVEFSKKRSVNLLFGKA